MSRKEKESEFEKLLSTNSTKVIKLTPSNACPITPTFINTTKPTLNTWFNYILSYFSRQKQEYIKVNLVSPNPTDDDEDEFTTVLLDDTIEGDLSVNGAINWDSSVRGKFTDDQMNALATFTYK